MNAPHVPISWGELLDKLTILEIKRQRIEDPTALGNVTRERDLLAVIAAPVMADVTVPLAELSGINAQLWDIEEEIRRHEAAATFDAKFIALARAVYQTNDRRAAVKREINRLLGSTLVEEKSYVGGTTPSDSSRSVSPSATTSVTDPVGQDSSTSRT